MHLKALCGLVLLASLGCKSDLGPGPTGHNIRGQVTYEGTVAKKFAHPILLVTADTQLSTDANAPPPYALATYEDIDLDKPMPYELRLLLPGRYFIAAVIGDRDNFDATSSPTGGYPNACVLVQMPKSRSVQMKNEDLTGINIKVYDSLDQDPCFSMGMGQDAGATDGGGTGTGTLVANVAATGLTPGAKDTLSVSLFDKSLLASPTPDPAYTQAVMGPSFPESVRVESVAAGSYTVVVCFQTADSPSATCMGPNDRTAFYPSLTDRVAVEADKTTTVQVELK